MVWKPPTAHKERMMITRLGQAEPLHLKRYRCATKLVEGRVVLDAACGCGYGSAVLAETAFYVIGVDRSEKAIKHARGNWTGENIEFKTLDLEQSWDACGGKIGAVVSMETVEHLDSSFELIFERVAAVLPAGGLFIYSHPIMEEATKGGAHKKFMLDPKKVLRVSRDHGFKVYGTDTQFNTRKKFNHFIAALERV